MNRPALAIGRASDLLGRVEPLPGEARTIERVLRIRREQVNRFGHTPEKDDALFAHALPQEARRYLNAAIDDIQFGKSNAQAIGRLDRAAALIFAAIAKLERSER